MMTRIPLFHVFWRRLAAVAAVAAGLLAPLGACLAQPEANAVKTRSVSQFDAVKAGETIVIAIVLDHQDGYHTYPNPGVALPPAVDEFATRTTVDWKDEPSWAKRIGPVQWPKAKPGKIADPTGESASVTVPLFSDRAVIYVPVLIAPDAAPGEVLLTLSVHYQACDDVTCEQPQDRDLTTKFRILAANAADQPKPVEPALFEGFKPATDPIEPPAGGAATGETPAAPAPLPSAPSLFGYSFGGGPLVLFLVAALGGFILNLTPCVLPVIPIKVLTLTKHAGTKDRALVLGVWMAAGVVAFWVAAGVPMAFISSAFDPSRYIFGIWWVALALGIVIGLLGLGIMGLFAINLPQSVYMLNPKVDNAGGSFLFGVLTAVLGLPCFGFVAGGLLAGAATLPPLTIMTVFLGLGVGMAAPYLVLSAKPHLLDFVPKTGPASNLVKQVMGLLLMAAAAYFVAAGIQGLLHERPYLADSMSWWAVTFFVAVAALWLTVRIMKVAKASWPKLLLPVCAAAAVAGFLVFTLGQVTTAKEDHLRAELARKASGAVDENAVVTGAWVPYNEVRLQKALAASKVVIVDFTARWCINCKFLKRTFLDRDPVRSRIVNDSHVLLEVDCTSDSAPGWKYLNSLGQTGVPTLAIYGPALDKPVIMNAYTAENVLDALDRATGRKAAAAIGR